MVIDQGPGRVERNTFTWNGKGICQNGDFFANTSPCGFDPKSCVTGEVSVGFVEENGGRAIGRNLTVGQSFIIPRGADLSPFKMEGCQSMGLRV